MQTKKFFNISGVSLFGRTINTSLLRGTTNPPHRLSPLLCREIPSLILYEFSKKGHGTFKIHSYTGSSSPPPPSPPAHRGVTPPASDACGRTNKRLSPRKLPRRKKGTNLFGDQRSRKPKQNSIGPLTPFSAPPPSAPTLNVRARPLKPPTGNLEHPVAN